MTLDRTLTASVVAAAVLTSSCSSTSPTPSSSTPTTASSQPTAPAAPKSGPLDQSTCLNISFTKDNLMVAQKPEDARRFADTLEKYGPPDPVKAAIEHFVTTLGAQPNDPDLDANRNQLTNWITQICPTVTP